MLRLAVLLLLGVAALAAAATTADVLPMHDGRIVGGKPASIENFPHQVSLERLTSAHFCGGSIFSENYIITAAHCVVSKQADQYRVRVGTARRGTAGRVYPLEWQKYHPQFTMAKLDGDVAILKLADKIVFGPAAQPIRLTTTQPRQGQMLTVTGWGTLGSGDPNLPNVLQVVRVPAIDRELCSLAYGNNQLTEAMICAGVSRKDSCQGDSGGPLINDRRELVGIVSFGRGCGSPGYPGVYANVASETVGGFISETTRE